MIFVLKSGVLCVCCEFCYLCLAKCEYKRRVIVFLLLNMYIFCLCDALYVYCAYNLLILPIVGCLLSPQHTKEAGSHSVVAARLGNGVARVRRERAFGISEGLLCLSARGHRGCFALRDDP